LENEEEGRRGGEERRRRKKRRRERENQLGWIEHFVYLLLKDIIQRWKIASERGRGERREKRVSSHGLIFSKINTKPETLIFEI
jgi:hypothetical protein